MNQTRTIRFGNRSHAKTLHIEAPGCIINISRDLHSNEGEDVTHVEIMPHIGERWTLDAPRASAKGLGVRVIRPGVCTLCGSDNGEHFEHCTPGERAEIADSNNKARALASWARANPDAWSVLRHWHGAAR